MSDKPKFPWELALDVLTDLRRAFEGRCDRLIAAGSLGRHKRQVGDLEVLFISKTTLAPDPADLFGAEIATDDTERLIGELLQRRHRATAEHRRQAGDGAQEQAGAPCGERAAGGPFRVHGGDLAELSGLPHGRRGDFIGAKPAGVVSADRVRNLAATPMGLG
jgi:hypothetical protein